MVRNSRLLGMVVLGALWLVPAGCAAVPASDGQVAETERRLIAPFLRGTEVGCNELLVEMTGNFNTHVGQPALDRRAHTMRHEAGDDYIEKIWTNTLGQTKSAFVVTIGEPGKITERGMVRGPNTTFTVVNQVRLRIYQGRHAVTLKAYARGDRVVVREASVARHRDVREFVIEDGVLKGP